MHCNYMKVLIERACFKRFKCVILNHRGCSHTPTLIRTLIYNYLAKLYAGSSIDDIAAGINDIHMKHKKNPLYAVGLSFGGGLLGNVS